jgi:ribosomal 50S subunit-associated protein YjgA (DUF615 family)
MENEYWRIRTNQELQELYKDPDIVADLRRRRLQWLGHMIRMDDSKLIKRVLDGKPGGRRTIGRPRLRWLEEVEKDLKRLKVWGWRWKAVDRQEWANILKEAKALRGP